MSITNYISDCLNLKDNNLIIYDKTYIKKIKNRNVRIIEGRITYTPSHCPKCGCVCNGFSDVIKWGIKRCIVKIPKISNCISLLYLDKQRFKCKHCGATFIADTDIVDHFKNISNSLNYKIREDLCKKESEVDIAFDNGISHASVNRILSSISSDKLKYHSHLPEILNIDEFNSTPDTFGKYACIITTPNTNKHCKSKTRIFEILPCRTYDYLYNYFSNYSIKERHKVKHITSDFFPGYIKLARRLFPNAKISIDRFHIVVQPYEALNSLRASLCKKSNPNYNKLKHFWKLILKDKTLLSDDKHYSRYFRKEVSQKDIVTYLINTNSDLKLNYNFYQGIISSLKDRNFDKFEKIIRFADDSLSKKMKNAIKLFNKYIKYIKNSFDFDVNNAVAEGTNNLIKCVKRIGFGYRKFNHLKARVILVKQGIDIRNYSY